MTNAEKIRVAVLYGGRSSEHEVSIRSAANVIQYLDRNRFEVIPIGIDQQGNWFLGNEVFKRSLENKTVSHTDKTTWFTPEWINKAINLRQQFNNHTGLQFDVVFPVLHGRFCEDGTLQGLLELANIPYVGCGVLASALGMDKDVSKRLAKVAGINVGPYVCFKKDQWLNNPRKYLECISRHLSYPVFVKPVNTGSSIGINKVKYENHLAVSIDEAFKFDTKVIIEKALNIIELELAVLESLQDNEKPIVSIVGEIRPAHEFYSYDAKYLDENGAELIIPANISGNLSEEAQQMASKLFTTLECEGMARVDLFYDKDTQKLYFNEINTIPGFTQISMYPKLLEATGIPYADLLTHLVHLALKRHQKKRDLVYRYVE